MKRKRLPTVAELCIPKQEPKSLRWYSLWHFSATLTLKYSSAWHSRAAPTMLGSYFMRVALALVTVLTISYSTAFFLKLFE